MYKAIQTQTGQEIIILSPFWIQALDRLREMDHADLLVCQGCRQPLRVKAGEIKRPHFAHKHLQACSLGTESPAILAARAGLYQWLFRQFGDSVNLEVANLRLPRPLDCWVERPDGGFAYWIIEAGIRLDAREAILQGLAGLGSRFHPVFISSMLNEEKKVFQSLLLTPTERAFMRSTPLDETLAGTRETGHSLHYLDSDAQTLITYRDLRLYHRPNWFTGMRKSSGLDTARASMVTGDPLHPGELDRLMRYKERQQRQDQKLRSYQEREAAWQQRLEERERDQKNHDRWGLDPNRLGAQTGPAALLCEQCGQLTIDYWYSFTAPDGRKLCRCRACLAA